jgi:UPF0716 protein FxsA
MARSRWRWWFLALLAWPALELVALTLLVDAVGAAYVWLWVMATGVLGIIVIIAARRRWRTVTADLRRSTSGAQTVPDESTLVGLLEPGRLSDPALSLFAGVLLLLPGPIGDVVGLALLIPGVRALFAAKVAVRVGRRFPQAASGLRSFRIRSGGTIVYGETLAQEGPGRTPEDPNQEPPALPPPAS